MCTTPELLDEATLCDNCTRDVCRDCPGRPHLWRCDSGVCVDRANLRDGKPDCLDGSDERRCKEMGQNTRKIFQGFLASIQEAQKTVQGGY